MKSIKNSQKLTDSWVAANREGVARAKQYLLPGRAAALLDGIGTAARRRRCLVPARRAAAGLRSAVGVLLRRPRGWRGGSARPVQLARPARRAPPAKSDAQRGRAAVGVLLLVDRLRQRIDGRGKESRPAPPGSTLRSASARPYIIAARRRAVLRRVVLRLARGNK